jgi:hypothetical protein
MPLAHSIWSCDSGMFRHLLLPGPSFGSPGTFHLPAIHFPVCRGVMSLISQPVGAPCGDLRREAKARSQYAPLIGFPDQSCPDHLLSERPHQPKLGHGESPPLCSFPHPWLTIDCLPHHCFLLVSRSMRSPSIGNSSPSHRHHLPSSRAPPIAPPFC